MEENNWATATLKEVPFWREGMSVDEYEKERKYMQEHWHDVQEGKYIPLWKQNNDKY